MLDSGVRFGGCLLQQHDPDYLTDTNPDKLHVLQDISTKKKGTQHLLRSSNFLLILKILQKAFKEMYHLDRF